MMLDRAMTLAGLLLGLVALSLQFAISIPAYLANGMNLPEALVQFFSFFTILTNIAITLVYLSALAGWAGLSWFRKPATRAMMAGVMALVMIFYHVLLRPIWQPEGLFLVCDYLLHYVTPIFYLLWWGVTQKHGALDYAALPAMLVPPLVYLAYVLARGALTNAYPYPTLNAFELGYGQVAINVVMVAIGLSILYLITIGIDRALARRAAIS
ncbi:Pr6Pr family membrane protein [Devosia sp. XJ19-1]|uniref:Pr6Pr family membrane protein n=1 Tax=Devosia ureilytica TaxID=2952754 RepID=A0A9Q4ANT8_9HYPH|nr:Pr6Pr family membrane protein [Devosia ureilytica]MCP8883462.1 Pr6Pr family membrane protein [Devosia ureilytica]MCP8887070.1 Pr6Pr family membrane protein [Devosia ureilytica]